MRKKLTNNIWAKLGSLACAVVIWLVIQSIADPMETKQFTDFPVEIRNEAVLKIILYMLAKTNWQSSYIFRQVGYIRHYRGNLVPSFRQTS